MRTYHYDHIHLRSPDPGATARFFETMFGAEVIRNVYEPGTLYAGQMRISMRLGGPDGTDCATASARPHRAGAGVPLDSHP